MKRVILAGTAALGVVVFGLLGLVATQPDQLVVSRSMRMSGAPEDVAAWTSDLRRVNRWSPWDELDPEMRSEYSETTDQVGSWYAWDGNDDVGAGRQTIQAIEADRVVMDLQFERPMESRAVATTSWRAVEGGTEVTWGLVSENDFMGKAFGMVVDMDAMLGADFEKGLSELVPLVEKTREEREAAESAARRLAEEAASVETDAVE